MSHIKQIHNTMKQYGYKHIKARILHKKIDRLEEEAQSLTQDADKFYENRKACWKAEDALSALEVAK